MKRLLLAALALLATAAPAAAQTPERTARVAQVDTSGYPEITLYVSVTDANGAPIGGLTKNDFAITEDGQAVEIGEFVGGGSATIHTALVIDRSGSMDESDKIEGAKRAATTFIEQMRPGDQTALVTFNSSTDVEQRFTSDQGQLRDAIQDIDADGGTALYDSVVAGVDLLAQRDGRRALVVLTDGQDCRDSSSCPDSYGSTNSLDDAIAYANNAGQPVYVIGLGNRSSDDDDGIDEGTLRQIAEETSGQYFYAPTANALADLYRSLSAAIQQEYRVTYQSPRPFYDGTRRDIRVEVNGVAAARSGYVEQHMIHVRSNPFVGLALLVPVLGALLLPSLLRRRTHKQGPKPADQPAAALAGRAAADGSTIIQPGAAVLSPDAPRCSSCDAELYPPNARFCATCGASQAASVALAKPKFCDQCGTQLRESAKFCSGCGARAPQALPQPAHVQPLTAQS